MSIISKLKNYLLPSLTGRGRGWVFSSLTGRGWGWVCHSFALIREDKLFSAIYIAGTAVAIASAMVIAILLNILLGDIAPESNRSRTLYLQGSFNDELTPGGERLVLPKDELRGGCRWHQDCARDYRRRGWGAKLPGGRHALRP